MRPSREERSPLHQSLQASDAIARSVSTAVSSDLMHNLSWLNRNRDDLEALLNWARQQGPLSYSGDDKIPWTGRPEIESRQEVGKDASTRRTFQVAWASGHSATLALTENWLLSRGLNLASPAVLIEARLTHDELAWCYREFERGVPHLRLRFDAARSGHSAAPATVTQLKDEEA